MLKTSNKGVGHLVAAYTYVGNNPYRIRGCSFKVIPWQTHAYQFSKTGSDLFTYVPEEDTLLKVSDYHDKEWNLDGDLDQELHVYHSRWGECYPFRLNGKFLHLF